MSGNYIYAPFGGPDGEMGASTRYLQQRYSMPQAQVKGTLTDIGISVVIEVYYIQNFFIEMFEKLTI